MNKQYINQNKKIIRNCISFSHASIVTICYIFNIPSEILYYISLSYYSYDIIIELYDLIVSRRLYNIGLIIHHIVACYTLNFLLDPIISEYLYYSFFVLEISNYPIYLVYHLKSNKYDNEIVIRLLIIVEALSFFIFRVILYGINIYISFMKIDIPHGLLFCALLIYVMSIVWLYGMINQIIQ